MNYKADSKPVKFLMKYTEKQFNQADLEFRRQYRSIDKQMLKGSDRMELLKQDGWKPESPILQAAMDLYSFSFHDLQNSARFMSECNLWKQGKLRVFNIS